MTNNLNNHNLEVAQISTATQLQPLNSNLAEATDSLAASHNTLKALIETEKSINVFLNDKISAQDSLISDISKQLVATNNELSCSSHALAALTSQLANLHHSYEDSLAVSISSAQELSASIVSLSADRYSTSLENVVLKGSLKAAQESLEQVIIERNVVEVDNVKLIAETFTQRQENEAISSLNKELSAAIAKVSNDALGMTYALAKGQDECNAVINELSNKYAAALSTIQAEASLVMSEVSTLTSVATDAASVAINTEISNLDPYNVAELSSAVIVEPSHHTDL